MGEETRRRRHWEDRRREGAECKLETLLKVQREGWLTGAEKGGQNRAEGSAVVQPNPRQSNVAEENHTSQGREKE